MGLTITFPATDQDEGGKKIADWEMQRSKITRVLCEALETIRLSRWQSQSGCKTWLTTWITLCYKFTLHSHSQEKEISWSFHFINQDSLSEDPKCTFALSGTQSGFPHTETYHCPTITRLFTCQSLPWNNLNSLAHFCHALDISFPVQIIWAGYLQLTSKAISATYMHSTRQCILRQSTSTSGKPSTDLEWLLHPREHWNSSLPQGWQKSTVSLLSPSQKNGLFLP